MNYKKVIYREDNSVVYKIFRISDDSIVDTKRLVGFDLSFFTLFCSYEVMIDKLFVLAHKRADKAIDTLVRYES